MGCCGSRPEAESPPPPVAPEKQDPIEELYIKAAAAWNLYSSSTEPEERLDALRVTAKSYQDALDATASDHPRRKDILFGLIFALLDLYDKEPARSSLVTIESCFAELEKGSAEALVNFGYAITTRVGTGYHVLYTQSPSAPDFDHYVSNFLKAVTYSESENQTQIYLTLAYQHYQQQDAGELRLENALDYYKRAKGACPIEKPDIRLQVSTGIYAIYLEQYWAGGSMDYLENAIAECKERLDFVSSSDRANTLIDLAHCIWILAENNSVQTDYTDRVKDAVRYSREAVKLGQEMEEDEANIYSRASTMLAHALSSRHGKPTVQDIDEAIALYREAKEREPTDAEILSNLAGAVWFRCERGGEQGETTLQAAIDIYTDALSKSSDSKLNSNIANNIGAIYIKRAGGSNVGDLELACQSYLNASKWCADVNDQEYYKGQVDIIKQTIEQLGGTAAGPSRTLSPIRRSTLRK